MSPPRRARRGRGRRRLVAGVAALGATLPGLSAAAEETPPTLPPASTTTAPGPGGGTTPSTSTTTVTTLPDATTSTTSADDAARAWREVLDGDAAQQLPPASPGLLPPEEELPPPPPDAPRPLPPPGADEAGLTRARLELRAAQSALAKARVAEARVAKRLAPLAARLAEARAAMGELRAGDRQLADELASARKKVKRIAVAGYVRGGDTQPVDYLLRSTDPVDLERRRAIVASASEARHKAVEGYAALQRTSSARLDEAVGAVDEALGAFSVVEAELTSAAAVSSLLAFDVEEKRQLLDHAAAAATVLGTDIPRLFFDAYRRAAATLARRAPNCRVGWPAIAGIGKIEANHGRYRGSQFALNGDVFPRILGIPLDGTRSALITDTDGGLLDGDLQFDRAVGPMQFIPSTWARINEDGNGDGISDPNNVYDAALGTAAYLCRAVPTGGLDSDEGLRPAFFSYNHSDAYVEAVLAWAHTYGAAAAP